jgi:3-hydroxyacyl-[acyl-carrier-protein] dehydratase
MTAATTRPLAMGEPLDRVLEVETGVRGTAVKNVPSTLPLLDSHFPNFPVLPGVLVLESMVAVAALVAGGGSWRLRSAHRVRFRHFVRPGDQVVISATVTLAADGILEVTAVAEVGATVVASAGRLVLERQPGVTA